MKHLLMLILYVVICIIITAPFSLLATWFVSPTLGDFYPNFRLIYPICVLNTLTQTFISDTIEFLSNSND